MAALAFEEFPVGQYLEWDSPEEEFRQTHLKWPGTGLFMTIGGIPSEHLLKGSVMASKKDVLPLKITLTLIYHRGDIRITEVSTIDVDRRQVNFEFQVPDINIEGITIGAAILDYETYLERKEENDISLFGKGLEE